jgi:hypothetical protein
VTFGERMVKLGAPVARLLDLLANLLESLHIPANVVSRTVFPEIHKLTLQDEKQLGRSSQAAATDLRGRGSANARPQPLTPQTLPTIAVSRARV